MSNSLWRNVAQVDQPRSWQVKLPPQLQGLVPGTPGWNPERAALAVQGQGFGMPPDYMPQPATLTGKGALTKALVLLGSTAERNAVMLKAGAAGSPKTSLAPDDSQERGVRRTNEPVSRVARALQHESSRGARQVKVPAFWSPALDVAEAIAALQPETSSGEAGIAEGHIRSPGTGVPLHTGSNEAAEIAGTDAQEEEDPGADETAPACNRTPKWQTLTANEKVAWAFAKALQRHGKSCDEAFEIANHLRHMASFPSEQGQSCYETMPNHVRLIGNQQAIQLTTALRMLIDADPGMTLDAATDHLEGWGGPDLKTISIAREDRELYRVKEALDRWVDWAAARRAPLSPTQLWQAVFSRHGRHAPPLSEELDPRPEDMELIDQMALIHACSSPNPRLERRDERVSLSFLRSTFLEALQANVRHETMLHALFRPIAANTADDGRAWSEWAGGNINVDAPISVTHDGLSFNNAKGQTLESLADEINWMSLPGFDKLYPDRSTSKATKLALLKEKFDALGESKQYPIGAPRHSLASTIIRVRLYQHQPMPGDFESDKQLLQAYAELERQWNANRDFPIHPRLLFALHLAGSSGAEIVSPDWRRRTFFDQILPKVIHDSELALENGNEAKTAAALLTGIEAVRDRATICGPYEEPGSCAQDDLSRLIVSLKQVVTNILGDHPKPSQARLSYSHGFLPIFDCPIIRPCPDGGLADAFDRAYFSTERLVGDDWKSKLNAVMAYANDRLLATFGTPPRFDRERAVEDIFRAHGLSDDEIFSDRRYSFGMPNFEQHGYGTLVEEYLDRVESGFAGDRRWKIGRKTTINPRDELEQAEDTFNAQLRDNEWVLARARENLRASAKLLTRKNVRAEAARIASNYDVESETHRIAIAGLETWIGFLPVIGATYSIADGIVHRNPWEIASGIVFLSLDGIGLLADEVPHGRVAPRTRPIGSANEHITVASVDHAIHKLGISRREFLHRFGQPRINRNPFGLQLLDADVPEPLREIAARVRAGERGHTWENHELVYLANEDRVVAVKDYGGAYLELDWDTGMRRSGSRLIHRTENGFISAMGLKGGQPVPQTEAMGVPLNERYTVQQVKELAAIATNTQPYQFEQRFVRCFEVDRQNGASAFDIKRFYRDVYDKSPTFRRLFNYATEPDSPLNLGRWKILVRKGVRSATHFDDRRILIAADDELLDQRYVGIDGFKQVQLEQAYLHEMLHALTLRRDPAGTLATRHRGPIVYLTDKILNEAGYTFPQQVFYRRSLRRSSMEASPLDREIEAELEGRRTAAAEAMFIEDNYLDTLWDTTSPLEGSRLVFGEPISQRLTVKALRSLFDESLAEELPTWFYYTGFNDRFQSASEHDFRMLDQENLRMCYVRIFSKSSLFRRLTTRWVERLAPAGLGDHPWKIDIIRHPMAPAEEPRLYVTDHAKREVALLVDGSQYLSEEGLRTVEFDRRLVSAMIDIMGVRDEALAGDAALRSRGANIYLTDAILQESRFPFPRQIASRLVRAADVDAQTQLRLIQTDARRAADLEDYFINQYRASRKCSVWGLCVP